MIVILSFAVYEQGTDPVIDWLIYYKAPFLRISIYDIVKQKNDCCLDIINQRLYINNVDVTDMVKTIWYRRFLYDYELGTDKKSDHYKKLNEELFNEMRTVFEHLAEMFNHSQWIPDHKAIPLNKLNQLSYAVKAGLQTPATILTNNKTDLLRFYHKVPNGIVTKYISDESRTYFIQQKRSFFGYTHSLELATIEEELPDRFTLSLFQEQIPSDFEIRVFIIDDQLFATASIYADELAEVDRKLYFKSKKTRVIPYKLPEEIREKLLMFMDMCGLNTGSVDIIKTKDKRFVFLEVNSGGQFLAPSYKCNLFLDKVVAEHLIKTNAHA